MGWSLFEPQLKGIPPPPPLPKYDPAEEAPMWDFDRIWWNNKIDPREKEFTRVGTQPSSPDDPDWRGVVRNKVNELPVPEPYNLGLPKDPKYFWFDTPDYADPFKKLGYCCRFFAWTGVGACSVLAIAAGQHFNLKNVLYQYRTFLGPWFFGGLAGGTTVVTVANLRGKKDDYWNYVAGGIAYATVFAPRPYYVFVRNLVLGVAGFVTAKHNAEINGNLTGFYFDFRSSDSGITGKSAEDGILSGDLRFGLRGTYGDPGRDVRKMY